MQRLLWLLQAKRKPFFIDIRDYLLRYYNQVHKVAAAEANISKSEASAVKNKVHLPEAHLLFFSLMLPLMSENLTA